ncbi:MAG: acyl-CoA dehydrogenase, partial [Rhodoferax sp.]|nr:acyl-CoA dehydrogenase [Rhodoferax sp.]
MNFDFSDDQNQLREAVRRWVDRAYPFERRRQAVREGGFSRDTWAELAGLGLCGLTVAGEHGGLGLGPVDAMVALEELGRGLVLEPVTAGLVACG